MLTKDQIESANKILMAFEIDFYKNDLPDLNIFNKSWFATAFLFFLCSLCFFLNNRFYLVIAISACFFGKAKLLMKIVVTEWVVGNNRGDIPS